MMIKKRNWLSLMVYLIIASVIAIFLSFLLLQICVELFFLIFYGLSFQMSNIDVWKCLKAGLCGGVVAGIGCWWIYYQHYRKNR
jgi:H+/Cl- antiporter ClcA